MKKKILSFFLLALLVGAGSHYLYTAPSSERCTLVDFPLESEELVFERSLLGGFSICLPEGFERDWDRYGTLEHFLAYTSYAMFKNVDWGINFTISDFYSPISSKPLDFSSFDAYIQSYKKYNEGSTITWDSGEEFLLKNGEKAQVFFGTIKHYRSEKISYYAELTTLHDGKAFTIFVDGLGTHKDLILASLLTYLP